MRPLADAIIRPQNRGVFTINAKLRLLLEAVSSGTLSIEAALDELRTLPYEDLGFAKVDHHRELRALLPEVVLAQGKTPEQIAAIGHSLVERSGRLLVTRLDIEGYRALKAAVPDAAYNELARVATVEREQRQLLQRVVFVKNGDKVKMQKVETGIADTTYIEIKSGIKPGDEVVSGSYTAISRRLKDGARVEIEKPGEG